MNKTVVLIFLSSVLLSSCGGADPVKYNDSLANYHKEADGYATDFNDKASNLLKERAAKNKAVIEAQADFARKHDIKITKGEDK